MIELTTEQQIYLLYARAYTEEVGTVTKGKIKSYLPKAYKGQAERIYSELAERGLIEPANRWRFSVTDKGAKVLLHNLATTDYRFDSVKGPKVLNTLLNCIREACESNSQITSSDEMSFEEFEEKFKALYFEERREQEMRGVVAIHSKVLCQKFMEENAISQQTTNQYFNLLKSTEKIFAVEEKGNELIEWVE
jgi:hypothetical protein